MKGAAPRVMAGFMPAIHGLLYCAAKDVDARHKAGHDDFGGAAIRAVLKIQEINRTGATLGVMAGVMPAIHVLLPAWPKTWMPATSAGMTAWKPGAGSKHGLGVAVIQILPRLKRSVGVG